MSSRPTSSSRPRKSVSMNSVNSCASSRWNTASLRAIVALQASTLITAAMETEAAVAAILRRARRRSSRRTSSSRPTPSKAAAIFNLAPRLRSPLSRASAASGACKAFGVTSMLALTTWVSALGKHSSASRPGVAAAPGSPPTITARILAGSRWVLNQAISRFTHCDLAEFGEQITIRHSELASASSTAVPMLAPAASSSRSLNSGCNRAGTGPRRPAVPTSCRGVR